MKPTKLSAYVALALAGSAWASSPYDTPYGVQWSFMIGHAGGDNPNAVAVSPDGTVWIGTGGAGNSGGSPMLTWGSPTGVYGGSWASGYGQISRNGGILQGNDIPNVAGISNFNQTYSANIAFVGDNPTAYFGSNPNRNMLWTDADPADASSASSQPMTFAIDSVLGEAGYDPYCGYLNAPTDSLDTVLPRKNDPLDPTKKFTHDMVSPAAYGGSAFDFKMGADGSYYIGRGAQGPTADDPTLTLGDSFTPGDFSGPAAQSYKPAVGKISADGLTKSGPVHQPACGGRSFFSDIDINESANEGAGRVYATGYGWSASGGTMDFIDPDGPGTDFDPIALDPLKTDTRTGFAFVYNATTWAIDKVVILASTYGRDIATDITATADGGFVLTAQTYGSLGGFTNPAEGTYDGYIEVYDADLNLAWNFQTETAVSETFGDSSVDADGNIYVSGDSDGNPTLWKFTADGTLVWATTIDNDGTVESQRDHAGDKFGIFYLSEHNPSGGATWTNTIAYVPQGNDENLLQRLSPGDFNSDGFTDFADVQVAGAATQAGPLAGDDTYDFDEDGDSTLADVDFMIATIMDRAKGDIHQDSVVTDVDNADIGRAIGAYTGAGGSGKVYLDGDIDFDGNVDDDDLAFVSGAFTGAKSYACRKTGSTGATLLYSADDGQVWMFADEAAGGMITSFQLESNQGTFVPAGYTGPAGGSFGGTYEEVTSNVIADSDLTLAGFSGLPSLGTIFPSGMDQAGLEAYLTTAVYTGEPGSGQMQFNVVVGDLPTAYEAWAITYPALTDIAADLDFEGDGLETGVEYVVGGDPTVNDHAAVAPTSSADGSGGLVFTFRRTDVANEDPDATIEVEYGSTLTGWTTAQDGVLDVSIMENDDFYDVGIDQVVVTLPASLAVDGKLFARLKVSGLPLSPLLGEDFDADDGGFTVVSGAGTAWEHGVPNSPDLGGGGVTVDNGGSGQCWGTGLTGAYVAGTDTKLRSPVIDLTDVASATLSFAQALDIAAGHTLVVNVIEEAGDTVLESAIHTSTPDPDINSAPWETVESVSITGGAKVRIEWHFTGAGDGNYLGAYLDDVKVSAP
jgi:hypothetical protein